jgi:hypothetical protein
LNWATVSQRTRVDGCFCSEPDGWGVWDGRNWSSNGTQIAKNFGVLRTLLNQYPMYTPMTTIEHEWTQTVARTNTVLFQTNSNF